MEKRLLYTALFLAIQLHLQASIIYVQADATGDGTSWATATGNLQAALQAAQSGDQIWVTKGVYFPTTDNNRTISFTIKNGVALYGSFAGSETSIEERIIKANYSVLSGEIGTKQKRDNTFNVLFTAHATKTTIIDGFIITSGYAGDDNTASSRFSAGAGWYNDGANKGNASNPTIKNCRFIENTARDGAAIYNNAENGGICQPTISNCTFQDNKAFLGGGAIFNNGQNHGNCLPIINKNNFSNNTAAFGGAIFNFGRNGTSIATIKNSAFNSNKALVQGGGIYNLGTAGISKAKLTNCEFLENEAPKGSTVANSSATPTLSKREQRM